jgi:hypothetical protein
MFDQPDPTRSESWRVRRRVKLRQMAADLRANASRRPPQAANTLRQLAVDLDRSANRLEDVIFPPA